LPRLKRPEKITFFPVCGRSATVEYFNIQGKNGDAKAALRDAR
jgi:hypothetical protein